MTPARRVILAIFVALAIVWLIVDPSPGTIIALAVVLVSIVAGAWFARRRRVSSASSGRARRSRRPLESASRCALH
jgi:UPF0716 family protein affecting phage T7 exclusion